MIRRFVGLSLLATGCALLSCGGDKSVAPPPPPAVLLAASTITSSVSSLVADGASSATITVTLKDSLGNAVGQSAGTVTMQASTGSLSGVIDHRDGTYTSIFTSPTTIGTATIFARLNGELLINNAAISFFAGPLDVAHSLIRAADTAITADGQGSTIVTVYTQDAHDNPVEIAVNRIMISTTSGTLGGLNGVAGRYSATLKSSARGIATISAQIDGRPLPSPATVRFAGNFWVRKASMPDERQVMAVGVSDGLLYSVGGGGWTTASYSATVEAYDPATDAWTPRASMPTARGELAAGVVNGVLYAVGGYSNGDLNTVEAYDIAKNTWSTKTPMPTAREGLAVGVVNGILYAVGGNRRGNSALSESRFGSGSIRAAPTPAFNLQSAEHVLSTVEAYDPATDKWTTKAPMPTARSMLAIGVVNGNLYAVGGIDATGSGSRATEAYDPATNSWTTRAIMPSVTPSGISYGRPALGVGIVDGILYAVGGFQVYQETDMVEAYNPLTNIWSVMKAMPTMRQSLGIGVINGVLYAVGGACYDDTFSVVEAYEPP